jgi:hypothetical protein
MTDKPEQFAALLMYADEVKDLERMLDRVRYREAKHIADLINRLLRRQEALVAEWDRRVAEQAAADLPAPLARAVANEPDPLRFLTWVQTTMTTPRDREPIN